MINKLIKNHLFMVSSNLIIEINNGFINSSSPLSLVNIKDYIGIHSFNYKVVTLIDDIDNIDCSSALSPLRKVLLLDTVENNVLEDVAASINNDMIYKATELATVLDNQSDYGAFVFKKLVVDLYTELFLFEFSLRILHDLGRD